MSIFNIVHVEEICYRGSIKDADVDVLRATVSSHPTLDAMTIDDLFRINVLCHLQTRSWSEFFIETVTDWVVREQQPMGYLTLDQVHYLLERLERHERIETKTEFDLILNLLDKSRWAPVRLAAAVLSEVHGCIATGAGVLRGGQERASGEITLQDLADIRRIVYAFGGDERCPLTRSEAEILFAIDECHQQTGLYGGWRELFTMSLMNIMLAASGYQVPTREVALAATSGSSGGAVDAAALLQHLERTLARYTRMSGEEQAIRRLERQRVEIVTGEQVEEPDAIWITERLDSRIVDTPHLMMLLEVMRDKNIRLHPVLQSLVMRHARAA